MYKRQFQNVVPTVTRLLNYDRVKVVSAITLGSLIPLLIYVSWCAVSLGGGMMTSDSGSGLLLTVFSMVTVAGSSIGALLSLSEECQSLLLKNKSDQQASEEERGDVFALPAVAAPAGLALVLSQVFADDITHALKLAGSYGSPLLYGLIPVAMAWSQYQKQQHQQETAKNTSLIPGGVAGLGVLGLGGSALIGLELMDSVTPMLS